MLVLKLGHSHFHRHIADSFNLICLSRFAEQNKKVGSYLPTAALLRSLQWVSDCRSRFAEPAVHTQSACICGCVTLYNY